MSDLFNTLDYFGEMQPQKKAARVSKKKYVAALNKEKISSFIEAPEKGEQIHYVSNGTFDYWDFVPAIIEKGKMSNVDFIGLTWTMNMENTISLFNLIDTGKIKTAKMVIGEYMGTREPVVTKALRDGLKERGGSLVVCKNHAKIIILEDEINSFVFEGSANFTANPRIEQFIVYNDKDLLDFHKTWINKL